MTEHNQYRTVTVSELSRYVAQGWEIVPSSAHTVYPATGCDQEPVTKVVVWRPNPLYAVPARRWVTEPDTTRGPQFPTPEELADLLEGC